MIQMRKSVDSSGYVCMYIAHLPLENLSFVLETEYSLLHLAQV